MSWRVPFFGLLAAGVFALSLSGCGSSAPTLSTIAIERAIAASILAQHNLRTKVECPSRVERRAGVTFVCTAKLEVGTYPVGVVETNDKGHVRYQNRSRLTVLDIARVQSAISATILDQRHLRSSVICPSEVIQRAGVQFGCTATVADRDFPFTVTEQDDAGHVRYVGHR